MQCIIRDTPLFYEAYGSGTPLIILHGFACDHRMMTGCMEPLFEHQRGWQRIYLDLPGMGQTPGMESIKSTDEMLDIVLDFIDAVIPGQRFLLVGESYGGYIAQGVVHRKFELVVGMALICSGTIMEPSQRDLPPRTVLVENPALLATLDPADAEEFASMAVIQDQYNWQRFDNEILGGFRLVDEVFLQKIREHYSYSFDVTTLPQLFSRPVVILAGRQDHIAGYRDAWRILENYPRATFAVLDRAGHNLHIEQPQLFNALLDEWLDRVREQYP